MNSEKLKVKKKARNEGRSEKGQEAKKMIERFQILSLDGGGIKGLFSAAVLAFLEEDHGLHIVDY